MQVQVTGMVERLPNEVDSYLVALTVELPITVDEFGARLVMALEQMGSAQRAIGEELKAIARTEET